MSNIENAITEINRRAIHTLRTVISAETAQLAIQALQEKDRLQQENEQLREQLKQFESLQTPQEANQYDCCPRCSTYLKDDNGVEGDYCPNCGQRIKWLKELGVEVRSGY